MSREDLTIRLGLTGEQQTIQGLGRVADAEQRVGREATQAGAKARTFGAGLASSGAAANVAGASMNRLGAGVQFATRQMQYGAVGFGVAAVAATKWGLAQNAAVENARIRFSLFTNDVDGLMTSVRAIDKESAAFGLAPLADAAAMLGNADVKNIPDVLRAATNAAAAGGKGADGLQSIVLALSQIQSKGKVSQEEINQLNEAGAPGTQKIIAKAFGLTADQLSNIGAEGLDANKAVQALTKEWTSGRMAEAAKRQAQSLSGQWAALTSNTQTVAAAMTLGLANSLSKDVLPAANKAAEAINAVMGDEGLSNEQKLRRTREIIKRELGPIAEDLKDKLDEANIPDHLGKLVGAAVPKMASAAADAAPEVAKAFVDGWMNSGPWVQIATVLFAGKKLNDKFGGGGKGGSGGALGGGGLTPVPVFVTNLGGLPGGGGRPGANIVKKYGPLVATRAAVLAPAAAAPVAAITYLATQEGHHNYNTRAESNVQRSRQGMPAIPGFGGGMPGGGTTTVIPVQIDGRIAGQAIRRGDDHMAARG